MRDLEKQMNNAKKRGNRSSTTYSVVRNQWTHSELFMLTHLLVHHLQDPPLMDPSYIISPQTEMFV